MIIPTHLPPQKEIDEIIDTYTYRYGNSSPIRALIHAHILNQAYWNHCEKLSERQLDIISSAAEICAIPGDAIDWSHVLDFHWSQQHKYTNFDNEAFVAYWSAL